METIKGSRRRVCIELEAPNVYLPGGGIHETLVSPCHVCNYCHGRGTVYLGEDSIGEPQWGDCPVCDGAGELDAVVTVEWRPVMTAMETTETSETNETRETNEKKPIGDGRRE